MSAAMPGSENSTNLTQEESRLQRELRQAREELALIESKLEDKGDFGLGQGAPTVYEWEMNLALKAATQEKIRSLEAALARLQAGTYGTCQVCGGPIDPGRLEILPETTLCIKCAKAAR